MEHALECVGDTSASRALGFDRYVASLRRLVAELASLRRLVAELRAVSDARGHDVADDGAAVADRARGRS